MEKFLIRTPKEIYQDNKDPKRKMYKQAKIENLKGVVVIEDIEKAKLILERKDSSSRLKISTLEKLSEKLPCKEVLQKTGIGKTVHKLCKDDNSDVAVLAKNVYKCWKNHIINKLDRPMIEVKCDAKTQQLRDKARALIFNALSKGDQKTVCKESNEYSSLVIESEKLASNSENLKGLSELIEREVFSITKKRINGVYRRANRKIVFTLRYKDEVRLDVIKSKISAQEIVKSCL